MFSKIFPPIHTEGYKFLVIAGFITLVLLFISGFLGTISLLLTVWVYYFFRDPERVIIEDDNYLVSPVPSTRLARTKIAARNLRRSSPHQVVCMALVSTKSCSCTNKYKQHYSTTEGRHPAAATWQMGTDKQKET